MPSVKHIVGQVGAHLLSKLEHDKHDTDVSVCPVVFPLCVVVFIALYFSEQALCHSLRTYVQLIQQAAFTARRAQQVTPRVCWHYSTLRMNEEGQSTLLHDSAFVSIVFLDIYSLRHRYTLR